MNSSNRYFLPLLALLVLSLSLCAPLASAQCSCIGCSSASISAGGTRSYSPSSPCSGGAYAVVSDLRVRSTDNSGFTVRTFNQATPSESFTFGTTTGSVTCFNGPSASIGRTGYNNIKVEVTCKNLIYSCPMQEDVSFRCVSTDPCAGVNCGSFGTCSSGTCVCNSGYSGPNCATPPAVDPVQPAGVSIKCTCNSVVAGYVSVSSCPSISTLANSCSSNFPSKCSSGMISGSCVESSGGGGSGGGSDASSVMGIALYSESCSKLEYSTVQSKNTCTRHDSHGETVYLQGTCSGDSWTVKAYASSSCTGESMTASGFGKNQCASAGNGVYVRAACDGSSFNSASAAHASIALIGTLIAAVAMAIRA